MLGYLRDAVGLLPERHRIVIVGYFLEGRTSTEIADLLGVTESRVSQLRSESLEMLREGIEAQYQTADASLDNKIGPYPLKISRDRVTVEEAEMRMAAGNPLVETPNKIGPSDFDGWVQERGLYYAETWDPRYTPIVRAADAGEAALDGGLLFARHGRGRYVYTGLSFFRQLPAGVPGAYRLFVNLIGGE